MAENLTTEPRSGYTSTPNVHLYPGGGVKRLGGQTETEEFQSLPLPTRKDVESEVVLDVWGWTSTNGSAD